MKYFLVSATYYFPGKEGLSDVVVRFITKGRDQDLVADKLVHKLTADTNIEREISFKDYTLLREGGYLQEV